MCGWDHQPEFHEYHLRDAHLPNQWRRGEKACRSAKQLSDILKYAEKNLIGNRPKNLLSDPLVTFYLYFSHLVVAHGSVDKAVDLVLGAEGATSEEKEERMMTTLSHVLYGFVGTLEDQM